MGRTFTEGGRSSRRAYPSSIIASLSTSTREDRSPETLFPTISRNTKPTGIDYVIYLGASMHQDGKQQSVLQKNFRLWQLMVACGIAWHTRQLKRELKVPLETAHLILVSDATLSIRFRFEEKRFDVDGAYDVRHEIIKSRLDKAMVKGRPGASHPARHDRRGLFSPQGRQGDPAPHRLPAKP